MTVTAFFRSVKVKGGKNMDDNQIVELYWQRSEAAIVHTQEKYGGYCKSIAYGILGSEEECEECLNDAYMRMWNYIPPNRPNNFKATLARTVRNLALNRCEKQRAKKRGAERYSLALEELEECIPSGESTENAADAEMLTQSLNEFLARMKPEARRIFMLRYWYFASVGDIARELSIGESKVKMSLMRSRKSLKNFLEKEGVIL